jgi:pimeloyl-ACP methyl ester carboxylesterase
MIVFLHGVPETAHLWDKVRSRLNRESVALSLPGFGCERPANFSATKDAYVTWLVNELEKFDEPVDLVAHDWGALLTLRVATAYGQCLRSWTVDVASGLHPNATWHDVARIWQTPGDGEALVDSFSNATAEQLAPIYEGYGLDHADALEVARHSIDPVMGQCILDLYRSATPNLFASWGNELSTTSAPGMVLIALNDSFTDAENSRWVANKLGARTQELAGVGHWWAMQDPNSAVSAITSFLDSIE